MTFGVAKNATLIAVRALNCMGQATYSDVITVSPSYNDTNNYNNNSDNDDNNINAFQLMMITVSPLSHAHLQCHAALPTLHPYQHVWCWYQTDSSESDSPSSLHQVLLAT